MDTVNTTASVLETKARMDKLGIELEQMIDQEGLDVVLAAIREVCYAKANHIAVEWQDVRLAKLWLAKGIRVNSAAQGTRE